jgi:hypothetical protein
VDNLQDKEYNENYLVVDSFRNAKNTF